jgi:hypothetical protein
VKKWLLTMGVVAAFVLGTYFWAWFESYTVTNRYLAQAAASLARGDIAGALKGKESRDPRNGAVVFGGGYQQVLDLWSAPTAWPKPPGYYAAKAAIADILDHQLTVSDGIQLFQSYYGRDNGLLPEVLLRVGALLETQGDASGAQEIYQTVVEAFPVRSDMVQQAHERLQALKARP